MKFKEIIESPINDLEIIGDLKNAKYKQFEQPDWDLLNSQKGVQKIRKQFEKTPFIFNFYIIFDQNKSNSVEKISSSIRPNKDEIYIIYSNNATAKDNYVPMNGWILAHRIVHVLQANYNETSNFFKKLNSFYFSKIYKIYDYCSGSSNWRNHHDPTDFHPLQISDFTNVISNLILTTKGARDNKIRNSLDPLGEVLAQYLLVGKIKLNKVNNWDFDKISDDSRYISLADIVKNKDKINNIIDDLDENLTQMVEELFNNLKGKVLHF